MSHATIFVLDQESAYDFYVNKLGFKVHTDAEMGPGMRWLTVSPPDQPDLEIILMSTVPSPMMDEDTCNAIRKMIQDGKLGAGVFETPNIRETYQDLVTKGVTFVKEPTEEFYGTEALMKDDSGNWFSVCERKEH